MKWFFAGAGLALLMATPGFARAPDGEKKPADQLEALKKEYTEYMQKGLQAYQAAAKEAKTNDERRKAFEEHYPKPTAFLAKFKDFAEKNASDPAAVEALIWLVTNGPRAGADGAKASQGAVKTLLDKHADSEKLGPLCRMIGQLPDGADHLQKLLEKNPHKAVKAEACMMLATTMKSNAERASLFQDLPETSKRYEAFMGKDAIEKLMKADAKAMMKEAEAMYERIEKDFADVKGPRGTMGDQAKAALKEMRTLSPGREAPEIAAEDTDGKAMKLTDYRGKVVMLDFWGHW
jgi:hypothetical protein